MGQLRELVHGDGSLDTSLRALALSIFAAVALALILTTVSVRRDLGALPLETTFQEVKPIKEQKVFAFDKEHMQ